MTRTKSVLIACVVACVPPSLATAQDPPPTQPVATPTVVRDQREEGLKAATAPASLSFGASPGTGSSLQGKASSSAQFFLDASAKEKVGTLALGWKTGKEHIQLALSGPLDSSEQAEPLSSTGGLTKGASARLSVNSYQWKAPTPAEQTAAEQLCARLNVSRPECSVRKLQARFPVESRQLADLEHLNDKPWLFGGEVSVNRRGFQFLRSDTLAAGSENKTGVSATGRLGVFAPSLGFLFASASYRRDFEAAGSPSNICRPLGASGALRCQQAVLGAPSEDEETVAGVELRRLFKENVGISPSVRYDFDAERWLVDVPLYVIPGSGKVSGGVRFNWRSDTKDLTAVVFVGTIFTLFD